MDGIRINWLRSDIITFFSGNMLLVPVYHLSKSSYITRLYNCPRAYGTIPSLPRTDVSAEPHCYLCVAGSNVALRTRLLDVARNGFRERQFHLLSMSGLSDICHKHMFRLLWGIDSARQGFENDRKDGQGRRRCG
jgi:hypothetical protein